MRSLSNEYDYILAQEGYLFKFDKNIALGQESFIGNLKDLGKQIKILWGKFIAWLKDVISKVKRLFARNQPAPAAVRVDPDAFYMVNFPSSYPDDLLFSSNLTGVLWSSERGTREIENVGRSVVMKRILPDIIRDPKNMSKEIINQCQEQIDLFSKVTVIKIKVSGSQINKFYDDIKKIINNALQTLDDIRDFSEALVKSDLFDSELESQLAKDIGSARTHEYTQEKRQQANEFMKDPENQELLEKLRNHLGTLATLTLEYVNKVRNSLNSIEKVEEKEESV
jgi:hypothetical protein